MGGEHISRETAIKSTWMILEGMGYPRSENRSLERTVEAVFKSAPAADVVEVVRCHECIHWSDKWEATSIPEAHYCRKIGLFKLPGYYCADGERKDEGQDDA